MPNAEEMKEELRKMKRKVSGTKAELQSRLADVFETNNRGWLTRGLSSVSSGKYLESGTFRDVYMVTYMKGPRKNMKGVYKVFKKQNDGGLFQEDLKAVGEDLKAVEEAGRIIKAFNEYNDKYGAQTARRRVYLNQPEVWEMPTGQPVLVEPFIDGTYAKFNSNSGWVNEGYNMMQALSHFSFHFTEGRSFAPSCHGMSCVWLFDSHDAHIKAVGVQRWLQVSACFVTCKAVATTPTTSSRIRPSCLCSRSLVLPTVANRWWRAMNQTKHIFDLIDLSLFRSMLLGSQTVLVWTCVIKR